MDKKDFKKMLKNTSKSELIELLHSSSIKIRKLKKEIKSLKGGQSLSGSSMTRIQA